MYDIFGCLKLTVCIQGFSEGCCSREGHSNCHILEVANLKDYRVLAAQDVITVWVRFYLNIPAQ